MKLWPSRRKHHSLEVPILSIVVPAFKVEQFLDECLDSLRQQDMQAVEIIVVDDGSPDKVAQITKRHAKADSRVRLITRPNGGLSAARMTGVEHARGTYLTFVDSDDIVTAKGFAAAIGSLEQSGSDWAMMPYRQFSKAGLREPSSWISALYAAGARTVKPAEAPEILVQATAWSKVYRRSFWDEARLAFRSGVLYEDQEVSAAAFVAAGAIDVVPVECYLWRLRAGSITRETSEWSLSQFFSAIGLALTRLDKVDGSSQERARQLLANDVPRYLRSLAKIDDQGFARELFAGIRMLWPRVDREAWLVDTPAEAKIVQSLVIADRENDVWDFIAAGGFDLAQLAFVETEEGPALEFPFFDDPTLDRAVFVLSERQTPADARALRVVLDEQGVNLEFMAYLRHLDTGQPEARAWLCLDGERLQALDLEQVAGPFGHRIRTTRASNERSVWRTRFDWPAEGDPIGIASELSVQVEVTHLGRTASTTLSLIDQAGSAAWPQQAAGWYWLGTEPARWLRKPHGFHTIDKPVMSVPILTLPHESDEGWWGFDAHREVVWHDSPAATREQETVWWKRDNASN